ncbi:MAG: hypothetical protein NTV34_20185, partial [Proteobacteria bacterium]|nr:hypothetical protein [Pseudomonadota bacterium]
TLSWSQRIFLILFIPISATQGLANSHRGILLAGSQKGPKPPEHGAGKEPKVDSRTPRGTEPCSKPPIDDLEDESNAHQKGRTKRGDKEILAKKFPNARLGRGIENHPNTDPCDKPPLEDIGEEE